MQTEAGKPDVVVAMDRTSQLAFAERQPQATQAIAVAFLERVLARIPYRIDKGMTDNGIEFRNMPHHPRLGRHPFGQRCDEWGMEQRFTKPAHPWTTGQVERMNRTRTEATIKRFHDETTDHLNAHWQPFLRAYNFAKRLKRLKGLTPYEFICAEWRKNPSSFIRSPADLTPGPYN